PAEASRSITRIATETPGCIRPGAWTLREAGNGPVVTRSSSTFGMSFAAESGAESGIVGLRCASCTATREASAKRRAAFAAGFLSLRRYDPDQVRRVAAPRSLEPAASQPPVGAPLGFDDYPQTNPRRSRLRLDDGKSRAAGPPVAQRRVVDPKSRQIRLEKRGGQLFDVQ